MSPLFSVIENKNFRYLWLGQITSQLAVNMMGFILMIRVYQQTASNIAVSGMLFTIGLPAIFFGILAGGIVDQYDKRTILIACNVLRFLLLVLFFFFSDTLFLSYTLAFVFSLITQFFIPAEAPSIPNLVKSNELLSANSLFTFSFYTSTIAGFIISGPLLRIFGAHNVFLVMAGFMLLASYFVALIPKDKSKEEKHPITLRKIRTDIEDGFTFIRGNQRVRQSLLLMTFSQALLAVLATLAPGFSDKTLRIVLEDASYIVMGPAALGLILGALWVGTAGKNYLKRLIILVGILGTGLILFLLSLLVRISSALYLVYHFGSLQVGGIEIAVLLLFLLGITNALISVPAGTVLQEATEGPMRGRIYGVLTALTGGAAVMPVILSGVLADTVGVGKTIFIISACVSLFGFYRLLKLRSPSFNIEDK